MNKKKTGHRGLNAGILFALLVITACSSTPDGPGTNGQDSDEPVATSSSSEGTAESPEDTNGDSETEEDPIALANQEWQSSAHATSFVVDGEGQNNSCARCHAPKEWI